ncbi:MAG: hypothetical protein HC927_08165 [Deltaproteobacteria bacterium]|nr:hypothetical protein [Deltaproteobacteria bacterium]
MVGGLGPERAGALPSNVDGRPFTHRDFRDASGGLRRQAVHYRIWRTSDEDPVGAPIELGGEIERIEWHVHIANKKASWYTFADNLGERGYRADHPLRNATITGAARRELIIDPGPRTLSEPGTQVSCDRSTIPAGYPGHFPADLQPQAIDTLGEAHMQADGSLLFVGGFGHAARRCIRR